jgi:hypothetical protein
VCFACASGRSVASSSKLPPFPRFDVHSLSTRHTRFAVTPAEARGSQARSASSATPRVHPRLQPREINPGKSGHNQHHRHPALTQRTMSRRQRSLSLRVTVAPTAQPSRAIHGCTDVTVNHLRQRPTHMAERLSGMEIRTPFRFNPRRTSEHHPNSHRLSTGPATPNLRGDHLVRSLSFTLRVHPRVLTILQQATRDKSILYTIRVASEKPLWRRLKCPLFSSSGRARRASSSLLPLLHSIPFHLLVSLRPPSDERLH